ncbi:TatD family hydrolase [Bacteroidia bacterium]|nr:TatD family hydrolase [Bacteroidia bacterium]GHT26847.1 TatD family hydrolase [Bacteroidia bacterium]
MIDTHTHIFAEEFDADVAEMLQRAEDAGVKKFCLPNIDVESIERLDTFTEKHPDLCYPMMGLHPTGIGSDFQHDLEIIRSRFEKRKYIAVGEIGLDLYWDKTYLKEQICAFEAQLQWSIDLNLPVAIHTREAFPYVFESLYKIGVEKLRGVFHSFGGSREDLEEIIHCENFMIGINGVITYKKADFRDYLPLAPLDRILLETDAPYLSPVPYRGKRNEPAYILKVVEKLAEVYQLPVETIAAQTTENALRMFNL